MIEKIEKLQYLNNIGEVPSSGQSLCVLCQLPAEPPSQAVAVNSSPAHVLFKPLENGHGFPRLWFQPFTTLTTSVEVKCNCLWCINTQTKPICRKEYFNSMSHSCAYIAYFVRCFEQQTSSVIDTVGPTCRRCLPLMQRTCFAKPAS